MQDPLQKLLTEYSSAKVKNIRKMTVQDCKLNLLQIRDLLCVLGKILYEDPGSNLYVAAIPSGFLGMNCTVAVLQLRGNVLVAEGYAKEGLIRQHSCERVLEKITDAARDGTVPVRSGSFFRLVSVFFAMLAIVGFLCVQGWIPGSTSIGKPDPTKDWVRQEELRQTLEATKKYNQAVTQFNQQVSEYNHAAALIHIDNIQEIPAELEMLRTVSETPEDMEAVLESANSLQTIEKDTQTVLQMTAQVESLLEVVRQITAPTDEWVMERLSSIGSITGMEAVTTENDPNGLLGKEGGFCACVYFTTAGIDPAEVPGDGIVGKGTDAGGAVEVYETLAEATARCEYLAGFDNTVLYSGSYAILGTMVIRTSYKLSNEQQLALTRLITRTFTALPGEGI